MHFRTAFKECVVLRLQTDERLRPWPMSWASGAGCFFNGAILIAGKGSPVITDDTPAFISSRAAEGRRDDP
jgi:hypothetical protein